MRSSADEVILYCINLNLGSTHEPAGACRRIPHALGHPVLKAGEYAQISPSLLPGSVECLNMSRIGMSSLDLRDKINELALLNCQPAITINAAITPLLLVGFHAIDKGSRPAFELEGIKTCQCLRITGSFWKPYEFNLIIEIPQMIRDSSLNDLAGIHANINPDPASPQNLSRFYGGAAAAEGIHDNSIRGTACLD